MASGANHRGPSRPRFDDEDWSSPDDDNTPAAPASATPGGLRRGFDDDLDEPAWSSYTDAQHGPTPTPDWVITDARAVDTDLGVLKTGKEAEVSLFERRLAVDGEPERVNLLAVKQYRSAEHRLFHRDSGYLEGRRVRRSRETRAMATRTEFGRDLIAGQWAVAEFHMLAKLWSMGVAVPYPVQSIGTELMMEFIGSDDGVAAPRLAQVRCSPEEAADLYDQLVEVLVGLAGTGFAHGDLSPYNVLVHEGRLVLIDLPQVVDIVGNPQGFDFLHRDCRNICSWFAARHVADADPDHLYSRLLGELPAI